MNLRQNSLGVLGGIALVNALEWNHTLKELVLTDNQVGPEVMTTLAGRLSGSVVQVCHSVSYDQLQLPLRYAAGRFDRIDLKTIITERKLKNERAAKKIADFISKKLVAV